MEILYLLIPIGLIFIAFAIRLLFWAIKSGQYDDLETESQRILFDEELPPSSPPPRSATKPATASSENKTHLKNR